MVALASCNRQKNEIVYQKNLLNFRTLAEIAFPEVCKLMYSLTSALDGDITSATDYLEAKKFRMTVVVVLYIIEYCVIHPNRSMYNT